MSGRITHEWALQLGLEIFGDRIDFDKVGVAYLPEDFRGLYYRVPILPEMPIAEIVPENIPKYVPMEIEDIEIRACADPINLEYFWMGYGERTNTLLISVRALNIPRLD